MPARSLTHLVAAPVVVAAPAVRQGIRPAVARVLLVSALAAGLGAGALAAAVLAGPAPGEAELTRLLRGMVMIKGLIALAAVALVLRRLGGAVSGRALAGYAGGLALTFAALGWLWGLSAMLVGSILFYGGLGIAGAAAARDPLLLPGLRR